MPWPSSVDRLPLIVMTASEDFAVWTLVDHFFEFLAAAMEQFARPYGVGVAPLGGDSCG